MSCLAPSQSMRFNHSGNVLACCFNRGHILGKFPEQSIYETWFGEKAGMLRDAISKEDYSVGCQSCEKNIQCGNREASGAFQYDYLKNQKSKKHFPTMFDFELGSTCNFECVMCSGEYSTAIRANREKGKAYYSPYEAFPDEFVDQLKPFLPHLKEMKFIGGEPFLMKIYYKIWDEVVRINPSISMSVLTNGSILNKRVMSLLEKGDFKISVSIDSLVKETYESIRKNGDFDMVMKNILFFRQLMKEKGHVMNFNLCVMRQNWSEIPDYFNYCNEHQIQIVLHTVEFPVHCSLWNLPAGELEKILEVYRKASLTSSTDLEKTNFDTFQSLVSQIAHWYEKACKREETKSNNKEELLNSMQLNITQYSQESAVKTDLDYVRIFQDLLKHFPEAEQIVILNYIHKIDLHLLLDEINVSSEERLLERFKIIAQHP